MFTGVDLIVLAAIVLAVFYLAGGDGKNTEMKVDLSALFIVGLVGLLVLALVL